MARLMKARGKWTREQKLYPADLIDRHLAIPLSSTDCEYLKTIQIEIFKDAEWNLIAIMAHARQDTSTLRTCWYLCKQEFLIRYFRLRAIYPVRKTFVAARVRTVDRGISVYIQYINQILEG
ncbi:hypothetical protein MRB53_040926 [Persea americana]|nr:hypothetical protein MRB53_040926 [Persea americana]